MEKVDFNFNSCIKYRICDVCRVKLEEWNTFPKHPSHFIDTCIEHKKYAKTFLVDIVAENLGLKDIEENRECEVCNKKLTDDEVQCSLKKNSFSFLCKKHLEKYARLFMLPSNAR